MKNPSQRDVALYASGFSALAILAFLLAFKIFFHQGVSWYLIAVLPLLAFGSTYFLVLITIEKFIYRKIKLIYKNIHSLKTGKDLKRKFEMYDNVIDEVEHEVLEYSKKQSDEIASLKKMENYRKEFIGNVSHELKTPIFNIQGYIHTLIDGGLFDNEINMDYLIKASQNADRLSDIVEDLILISQYESGQLQLEKKSFDIRELVIEQFELFEMQADVKDIELDFKEGKNQGFKVEADRKRISQVLNNLISNSIKYGNEGGTILIGMYDMDENILIEISDDGPGVDQEHISRLFERFYRVDQSRSRDLGGTGLGLAIVKHIIEAHDQTVYARSAKGRGTTIGFTLKKGR